ncbi:hypothetical protein VTL71DRAFT_5484 [Oculimacula yallundae]|uniref:Uncharacterized protein n=1 Tax=Oculimacula yallundae TaxID=86028 RepID=A0ABR4C2W8_9HELO
MESNTRLHRVHRLMNPSSTSVPSAGIVTSQKFPEGALHTSSSQDNWSRYHGPQGSQGFVVFDFHILYSKTSVQFTEEKA